MLPTPPIYYAPLALPAFALTAGILLDRHFLLPLPMLLAAAATSLVGGLLVRRNRLPFNPWILSALAALGAAYHNQQCRYLPEASVARILTDKPMLIRARGMLAEDWSNRALGKPNPLLSQPKAASSVAILEVHALERGGEWIPREGRMRLTVPGRLDDIKVGDELEILGWANRPGGPANPGEWDYARWLADQGIVAELRVRKSQNLVTRLAPGGTSLGRMLAKVRAHGQEVLQSRLADSEYGLSAALLLGMNEALPTEEWDHYVRTGVIHVLAISGQHLVILGLFLRFLLRLAGVEYRRTALIVIAVLFAYALLTGGRPSAMRAAVMVAAGGLGLLLGKKAYPANTFALAWIAVLLLNPGDLFNSGFQLSFFAVAVLIWGLPLAMPGAEPDPLQKLIAENESTPIRLLRWLSRELKFAYATTLLIGLALIPLIVQWQNLISLSGLLIGPPVILLSTVALFAGFALFADALVGGWTAPLWLFLLKGSLRIADEIVRFADGQSWGCWYTGPLPMGAVVGFYGILGSALIWSKWREYPLPLAIGKLKAGTFLKAALACLLIGFLWPMGGRRPDELAVHFLAVGHGGCTLLELPDGRVALYDAGSLAGPDIVPRHVAPFLWHRGIRRIDEVFLSHADLDHFNGLPALLQRFAIGRVTSAPSFADKKAAGVREVLRVLERQGVAHRTIHAPASWTAGAVDFTVLHPPAEGPPGVENVRSLVLRIDHAGHRILLTGDIEKAGLDRLLSEATVPIDVLMAPHHGSPAANPVRLLEWAKPKLVVVPNAEGGIGGFEGKLKADASVPVWSTGTAGLITVRSHRTGLLGEAFRSGELKVITSGGGR